MDSESMAEVAVKQAWCRVLEIDEPSLDDNFFDLGGTSISAIRLLELIEPRLGIDFPIESLFLDGSLRGLIAACEQLTGATT